MDGYIDEFKFYARALSSDEIAASAAPALGGVEPNFVELGCMGCELSTASSTCAINYHLCNSHDLYAGGYMVARAMGWSTSNSHVWTSEEAREARRRYGDLKQHVAHLEAETRKAAARATKLRELEKAMGMAEAAATHHVPRAAGLGAVVDAAARVSID